MPVLFTDIQLLQSAVQGVAGIKAAEKVWLKW